MFDPDRLDKRMQTGRGTVVSTPTPTPTPARTPPESPSLPIGPGDLGYDPAMFEEEGQWPERQGVDPRGYQKDYRFPKEIPFIGGKEFWPTAIDTVHTRYEENPPQVPGYSPGAPKSPVIMDFVRGLQEEQTIVDMGSNLVEWGIDIKEKWFGAKFNPLDKNVRHAITRYSMDESADIVLNEELARIDKEFQDSKKRGYTVFAGGSELAGFGPVPLYLLRNGGYVVISADGGREVRTPFNPETSIIYSQFFGDVQYGKMPFIAIEGKTSTEPGSEFQKALSQGRPIKWIGPDDKLPQRIQTREGGYNPGGGLTNEDYFNYTVQADEYDEFTPENVAEAAGHFLGTFGGMTRGFFEGFTVDQISRMPGWEQIVLGTGMFYVTPAFPHMVFGTTTAIRGGLNLPVGPGEGWLPGAVFAYKSFINRTLKSAWKKLPEQEKAYAAERAKRFAEMSKELQKTIVAKGRLTLNDINQSTSELYGKLPNVKWDAKMRDVFDPEDIDEIVEFIILSTKEVLPGSKLKSIKINERKVNTVELHDNIDAFTTLLEGKLPTRRQLDRLDDIFGDGTHNALRDKNFFQPVLDGFNMLKLVASADFGVLFRQGWKLLAYPTHKNWIEGAKIHVKVMDPIFGQHQFNILMGEIQSHPLHQAGLDAGMAFMEIGKKGKPSAAEGSFVSNLAQYIPIFRESERGYVGSMNYMRWKTFYDTVEDVQKRGGDVSGEALEDIATLVQYMSGRGGLSVKPGGHWENVLNTVFFSFRYRLAAIQSYLFPISKTGLPGKPSIHARTPEATRLWAQLMIQHVMKSVGVLYLLKEAGKHHIGKDKFAYVDMDPRSSGYGSARIHDTRIDLWGADKQWVKLIARVLLSAMGKDNVRDHITGELSKRSAQEEIGRFIRGMLSPGAGLTNDYGITGTDFLGDNLHVWDLDTHFEQLVKRFSILWTQDFTDIVSEEYAQMDPFAGGAGAVLGANVVTYKTLQSLWNAQSIQEYNMPFNELIRFENGIERQEKIKNSRASTQWQEQKNRRRPVADSDEVWRVNAPLYNKHVEETTDELKVTLDYYPVMHGTPIRRKAVERFLLGKSQAASNLFPQNKEDLGDNITPNQLVRHYRDRYWGAVVPYDLENHYYNYPERDRQRVRIINEAVAAAQANFSKDWAIKKEEWEKGGGKDGQGAFIDLDDYIKAAVANPKTIVSDDKVVNEAILTYYDDLDFLSMYYWEAPVVAFVPENKLNEFHGYRRATNPIVKKNTADRIIWKSPIDGQERTLAQIVEIITKTRKEIRFGNSSLPIIIQNNISGYNVEERLLRNGYISGPIEGSDHYHVLNTLLGGSFTEEDRSKLNNTGR